jgi:hypothetical protein
MHWVLACQSCLKLIPHSLVKPHSPRLEFIWPVKPEFPEGGQTLSCPHCAGFGIYQRHELFMQMA